MIEIIIYIMVFITLLFIVSELFLLRTLIFKGIKQWKIEWELYR